MFEALLARIARALDSRSIRYMVIGGQAVLLYGEPRFTRDVDVALHAGPQDLPVILQSARESGLQVLVDSPADFVQRTLVLPCAEPASGIRVDLIFSLSPYERQAIQRAATVSVAGSPVCYAAAEDLIILKTVAGRPRDMEDVRSILLKQPQMDATYVRRWLREIQAGQDEDFFARFEEAWKQSRPPRTK
jgi:predicted nucleotidyltransferase